MDEQEFQEKLELIPADLQETISKASPGMKEIFLRMYMKAGIESEVKQGSALEKGILRL
ncbi:MAG: hypothetical protein ABSH41_25280 [Syntrophobacteraceae bacterium]|jgi:hypothetical protein